MGAMPISVLALAVAALGAATPAAPSLPAGEVPPALRLPAGVRPVRGEVSLTLDPAAERYRGRVRYPVVLDAPARVVWLHAEGLEIEEAKVGGRPARAVLAEGGLLGLVPDAPQPPGEATVEVAFAGAVDRVRSRGIYAVPEAGRWYAYTFFEPADARRAFPCFDEPGFKIPWRLSLSVKPGDRAIANAPAAREVPDGGGTRVEFAETRPLPSYLVAFVVGPFDLVDGGAGGAARVPVRFVVPRGRGGETRYAASVTARMLDLIEAETGVPYPYEKCDVAVVPRYWGTMEHPGIVALGQPLTLIPPAEETRERRLRYATIAIHELVHHWFGDLVTMAWWDDTWLNESLTSFLDTVVVDALEPAWRSTARRRAEGRASALEADVLAAAKRLREPVGSRDEIEGAFDNAITYDKGAAVAAMYERFLGREAWRAALPLIKLHQDLPPEFRNLAAFAGREMTGKRVADMRGKLAKLEPQLKASELCSKLAALPFGTGDAFVDRDAVDLARTVAGRLFSVALYRYASAQDDWLSGRCDAAAVQAAGGRCMAILTALRDILALHDDYSMNASMAKLQAVHPVNSCFEQALKGNAENGYCRTYIYELFNDYYLPQLALYTKWVDERITSGDTQSPMKPAKPLPMKEVVDAFYAKPLAEMAPHAARTREAYRTTLLRLAADL
jgi:hypothetical protein